MNCNSVFENTEPVQVQNYSRGVKENDLLNPCSGLGWLLDVGWPYVELFLWNGSGIEQLACSWCCWQDQFSFISKADHSLHFLGTFFTCTLIKLKQPHQYYDFQFQTILGCHSNGKCSTPMSCHQKSIA